MRLTPDLVALVRREGGGQGNSGEIVLPPGVASVTDEEQIVAIRELLQAVPAGGEVWVFAYGSLIWNPACKCVEQRTGVVRGWHRSFCLGWDRWFRGHPEQPGLMLSLDRGGQTKGVAYRLPPDALEENMLLLYRREMRIRPPAHLPRWVNVATSAGNIRAFTFVINRNGGRYVSGLSDEAIADALATAVGHRGSMAEYLHNTVRHLEELGLRDGHLWRLQEMVAERIEVAREQAARPREE